MECPAVRARPGGRAARIGGVEIANATWARWALLIVLTGGGTAGLTPLGVPSPALFAGLLVATALALGGLPVAVPRPLTAAAQAVIGRCCSCASRR